MRYQSNRPKRQFLAGVVCKSCGKQDSTVQIITFDPPDEYIECIKCNHSERRPTPDEAKAMQANDGFDQKNAVGVVKFLP